MLDVTRQSHFADEPGQRPDAARGAGRQQLERHWLTELQIFGSVHLSHGAAAQQADDAEARGE
jgi:hypothetical protein